MIVPSAVELNSVRYRLHEPADPPYREFTEPALIRQPEIAGSSFQGARESRPDLLSWKLDNWAGGEGTKVFDSSRAEHRRTYQTSSGPVTISSPGKLSLGLALTESLAIAAGDIAASGPYLGFQGSNVWVFHDELAKFRSTGIDTWTAVTTGAGVDTVRAPVLTWAGALWACYNTAFLRKITTGSNVAWTNVGVNGAIVVDSRVFFLTGSSPATLRQQQTSSAGTSGTTVYSIEGITSANSSSFAATGSKIYFTMANAGEEPRLFLYDGAAGIERMRLPHGFRMDIAVPIADNLEMLNDVIFIGGWFEGDRDTAALLFVHEDTSGTIGLIRDDTAIRITGISATGKNELLIGTRQSGSLVEVYRYDMATGGLSLFTRKTGFAADRQVVSIQRGDNAYFFGIGPQTYSGTAVGSVERTTVSGTGRYAATTQVTHPIWDFDLPAEEKILTEVEMHVESMPAGTSVSLAFSFDGGADVTTDRNGTALTLSSPSLRTLFLMDDKFRWCQPKITLDTTNTANTPVVLSVTLRATTVNFIQLYEVAVDLMDDLAGARRTGQQITGAAKLANLRTLRDNKAVFDFKPFYASSSMRQYPGPTAATKKCVVRDMNVSETQQGQGFARLVLREI